MKSRVLDLNTFLVFDYSQCELRMLAILSGDPLLIQQFNSGEDVHCLVGNTLTGWSVERIKSEKNLRKMVKNMHFGIIFGLTRNNMFDYVVLKIREIDGPNADLTGITKELLGKCYDAYFKRYKGVSKFISKQRYNAEHLGYVESLFGFRREIFQEDDTRTTYWGNQAVNAPVQSSAHTLLLIALALIHLKPRTYNLLQGVLMEIHDALNFLVKVRNLSAAYFQAKQLMEKEVVLYTAKHFKKELPVPLVVEASAGFNLGSLVDYEGQEPDLYLNDWRAKHKKIESEAWIKIEKGL